MGGGERGRDRRLCTEPLYEWPVQHSPSPLTLSDVYPPFWCRENESANPSVTRQNFIQASLPRRSCCRSRREIKGNCSSHRQHHRGTGLLSVIRNSRLQTNLVPRPTDLRGSRRRYAEVGRRDAFNLKRSSSALLSPAVLCIVIRPL